MKLTKNHDMQTFLEYQNGKAIKVILSSGKEIEGTLATVGLSLIHLTEVNMTSHEAFVPINAIHAVVMREESPV